ncbi:MAG TPA: PQQ-dependent dehydrogenase, methanol/ethanol family [Bryobacteraceae bacterium]|nr:PQQ-dependent dehydrogenase, methanol/ethanol family [Bryobacteraceae bacterium]
MAQKIQCVILTVLVAASLHAQQAGRRQFGVRCAPCHGANGRGGERGPDITSRNLHDAAAIRELIRNGMPTRGMPAMNIPEAELEPLIAFVRTLEAAPKPPTRPIAIRGPKFEDVANPKAGEWLSYNGQLSGNRHSSLDQIHVSNVGSLAPAWIFPISSATRLQVTPVVVDGEMYVTSANEVYAIEPTSGRTIWTFHRPRTRGLTGDAAGNINRGVALLNDRVFLVTDHAHLLALDRATGRQLWDVEMADYRQNYGATSAPLVVKDLVISGTSGGDEGVRGFIAAYQAATGKEVWRFWTVPRRGEPEAETWIGKDLEHGCATAWLTGTYDPVLNTVYWPTGNPCPDYNGDERRGDNLYSSSVVAINPETGKLRWHYQFTPHDLHDWDATQAPVLVDTNFEGRPRKLLLQANRNGFFYVLDRTEGKLLLAKPFVTKLTWAKAIGPDGRPILNPGAEPTPEGVRACPAVEGATNWMSPAFHPGTGFYYVMALEKCNIYTKAPAVWEAGKSYYGGDTKNIPGEPGRKYLRAIDIQTGRIAWELAQDGPGNTWGGVLSTSGGLVFFAHDSGDFAAADAKTGKLLWSFPANQSWKSSPMTYMAEGKQYVATAAGGAILVFALR